LYVPANENLCGELEGLDDVPYVEGLIYMGIENELVLRNGADHIAVPATYEIDGKQYVAVQSGWASTRSAVNGPSTASAGRPRRCRRGRAVGVRAAVADGQRPGRQRRRAALTDQEALEDDQRLVPLK
jgi:hypothetical protein